MGIAIGSEIFSSSPDGIGPYQAILLILGGLISLLGIIPSAHFMSKVILFGLSFVVSIILIEGVLLMLSRANVSVTYPDTRELEFDEILGKRTPSGAVGHDELGWRNEKVLDKADIVTIGDSQTWGVNATLSQTYPSVLSALTGYSVYSMAQGSYGAVQYRVLTERALELSPRLIIIGLYFGNDFADAYSIVYGDYAYQDLRDPSFDMTAVTQTIAQKAKALQPDGLTGSNVQTARSNPAEQSLWERVQSATYIGKFLTNVGVFDTVDTGSAEQQLELNYAIVEESSELFGYYHRDNVRTFFTPAYRQLVVDMESPIIQEGIRISKLQYLEIDDLLNQRDIELLVLLIPTKEYIYAPFLDRINDVHMQLVEDESQLRNEMMDFFDQNQIVYLDTLPTLREAVDSGITIYSETFDGHPIDNGYRIMAETVADYIRKNDIIK